MSEVPNRCHPNEGEFEKICGKEGEEMKLTIKEIDVKQATEIVRLLIKLSKKSMKTKKIENNKKNAQHKTIPA